MRSSNSNERFIWSAHRSSSEQCRHCEREVHADCFTDAPMDSSRSLREMARRHAYACIHMLTHAYTCDYRSHLEIMAVDVVVEAIVNIF